MTAPATQADILRAIRAWLAVVIVGLLLSGITAFPLVHETSLLVRIFAPINLPALKEWLARVHTALAESASRYPFLAYDTDWLAFAHLVIAVVFVGPWRDPVRNRWVVDWGLFACASVPLLAFLAGPVRDIPFFWRLIDASFGLFCCLPLLRIRQLIQRLETLSRR